MAPLLETKEGVSIIVQGREHLPPHIHASYGDDEALVDIRTGQMFKGIIPKTKLKVVQEWLGEGDNRKNTEENFYELNPRLRLMEIKEEKPIVKKLQRKKK